MCGFLIFFFFLEIEKLTPYPSASFPPTTVSTVKKIECHSIKKYISNRVSQYQHVSTCINMYQHINIMYQHASESDTCIRI